MATAATAVQGKTMTLSELRVFELKQELEKRGLDKSGIKLALVERLEGALREEGHDPKTYKFTVSDYGKSPALSKGPSSESSKEVPIELATEAANGHHENVQQEVKTEDGSEHNASSEISIKSEVNDGENKRRDILMVTKEAAEVKMEDIIMKLDETGSNAPTEQGSEDHDKTEADEEQMEVSEIVVEETTVIKEDGEAKEPEEEIVKEMEEEVNYEDEEMTYPVKIHEEEGGKGQGTEDETAEKVEEQNKLAEEKMEEEKVKVVKEVESTFSSSAETVSSTPAERVESTTHTTTTVLKKADNSLWIKGISPTTKAADLKALFAKYGRVLTAKIFTRRQQPSNACFGFVTMVDAAAADLCIQKLHKTTIKGRPITVERADRCNMPIVKSIPKKTTSGGTGDARIGKSTSATDALSRSSDEKKSSGSKAPEKSKKDMSSTDKSKSSAPSGDKASSAAGIEKQKSVKAASDTKKSPVKAPSAGSTTHSKLSYSRSKHPAIARPPPRFRAGRRIERVDRVSSTLRHSYSFHKPSYSSAASRRALGSRSFTSRYSRGSVSRGILRREVSSRRVEPPSSWEKRDVMEMLRKKEEEHRLKEQELRLQRERERLKFERERIERERLELQQLRQITALTTPVQSMMPAPSAPPLRRSHEYSDVDSSRYKSEKKLKRSEYSRRSGERSSSHRGVTSSRSSLPDRREPHSSSRHVSSTHSSSRATAERSRERSRDRSRHSTREYGSSSATRESVPSYGRDSHLYSRSGDPTISSSCGRDPYRPDSTNYSSHRSSDSGYGSRDIGTYNSSSTYSRDVAPSSYSKDAGYGSSSRSLGGGTSWSVGGSSSGYMGSSRDYDSGAWISGMSTSQSHGNHGLGSGSWSSSRDDHWSGSGMADTHGHVSSYDKYDKYDSCDKYSRRY